MFQNFHYPGSCPYCVSPAYNQIPTLPPETPFELLPWIQHQTARLTELEVKVAQLEARLADAEFRRLGGYETQR